MTTLRLLLATGAAALALASPAYAGHPTMPKQFQGVWCDGKGSLAPGAGEHPITWHRCSDDEPGFNINPTTYDTGGSNWYCTFTSIKFNKLLNGVNVDSTCVHHTSQGTDTWKDRAIFTLDENNILRAMTLELRDDKVQ
jgi:hypothetical protein